MELSQRDITTNFDDVNPGFQYQGTWQEITGSTRQQGGGVRSTQQTGASLNFTFFGVGVTLYQTVQSGTGSVTVDVSVDGNPPQTFSTSCGGEEVFGNAFFTSDPLAEINHTVVITNRGKPSIPFQFDSADIRADLSPTVWQPSQTNALFISLTPLTTPVVTQTSTSVFTTQNTTRMQTSRLSKATSSPERHIFSPSVSTSAATSASITSNSSQTTSAPPSRTTTETDNPGVVTTQNTTTAAVAIGDAGRQVKPTLIILAVVLACLMTVVVVLLFISFTKKWRFRVSKSPKDDAADKSTQGAATRPDPFTLDLLHPSHIFGGSPIDQSKRDASFATVAHIRIPDSPPDYLPVIH